MLQRSEALVQILRCVTSQRLTLCLLLWASEVFCPKRGGASVPWSFGKRCESVANQAKAAFPIPYREDFDRQLGQRVGARRLHHWSLVLLAYVKQGCFRANCVELLSSPRVSEVCRGSASKQALVHVLAF